MEEIQRNGRGVILSPVVLPPTYKANVGRCGGSNELVQTCAKLPKLARNFVSLKLNVMNFASTGRPSNRSRTSSGKHILRVHRGIHRVCHLLDPVDPFRNMCPAGGEDLDQGGGSTDRDHPIRGKEPTDP